MDPYQIDNLFNPLAAPADFDLANDYWFDTSSHCGTLLPDGLHDQLGQHLDAFNQNGLTGSQGFFGPRFGNGE